MLFSPPVYDACATDLWSLGVTLSMFYTELGLVTLLICDDESERASDHDQREEEEEDEEEADEEQEGYPGYIAPGERSVRCSRKSLFKASRGEIGLIWSVFRLLGTPTESTWPVSFSKLVVLVASK